MVQPLYEILKLIIGQLSSQFLPSRTSPFAVQLATPRWTHTLILQMQLFRISQPNSCTPHTASNSIPSPLTITTTEEPPSPPLLNRTNAQSAVDLPRSQSKHDSTHPNFNSNQSTSLSTSLAPNHGLSYNTLDMHAPNDARTH